MFQMTLNHGEIVIIDAPFHQVGGAKTRPVVVVLDSGDADFVAVPITTRSRPGPFDVAIHDWISSGLS